MIYQKMRGKKRTPKPAEGLRKSPGVSISDEELISLLENRIPEIVKNPL
jgi:hypothetical protein